ncbi:uncharacterized protein LOC121420164 isoform X2 [Lytechinus variegatus]|uniref:uncharacterized protein LOC121420164 isoform X2 n=1 Tax=Lytechinus variegatus TaxID=7654 RepID=UPI001BB22177|nr:uncharacterized protein LOC121420164 isoform X2 [Lytechinus variegatus]
MAEDSSRRKSNNPSRVLQTTEAGDEEQSNQEFNETDILEIPDDDGDDDSKDWYQSQPSGGGREEEEEAEDGGRGFVFSSNEVTDNVVVLTSDMELPGGIDEGMDAEIQGRGSAHSILHGSRSLKPRKQVGSSFNRSRQFMGVSYDSDQVYPPDGDSSQVRRQQRAVEPFVCRTTSSSGKKDASMQFPDDELSVLREENDALRKENSELRKKVDRLVETIALNDALPNLLATLRGAPTAGGTSQNLSTSTDNNPPEEGAVPSTSASPQVLTISRCQSLANDDPSSNPPPSSTQNVVIPVSDMGVALGQVVTTPSASSHAVTLPQIPLSQVSLPQLAAAMDQDLLPHQSQQQVNIPRAPVLPVLAPSIQMGLTGQPPMVPPGAPSQLAMIQQSLPNPVPQSTPQTVLQHVSHMAGGNLAPVRIRDRGKLLVRPGGKQTEDSVEISLSNNVKVDKRLLDRCNHTNFRKLTSDLLMCLFPRKVLSRSTLGGTSNTISRTTGLPTNKTRLDPEKVEAILDYVQRVTGVPARAVKDAIRTKLNNEAKRMHRQLIFKRSFHYSASAPDGPP